MLADVHSDEEDAGLANDKTRGIIDEQEDVDAALFKAADDQEDDEDYETIIEKELDNWFN